MAVSKVIRNLVLQVARDHETQVTHEVIGCYPVRLWVESSIHIDKDGLWQQQWFVWDCQHGWASNFSSHPPPPLPFFCVGGEVCNLMWLGFEWWFVICGLTMLWWWQLQFFFLFLFWLWPCVGKEGNFSLIPNFTLCYKKTKVQKNKR